MSKKIYIAGAHSRGQTVAFYLTYLDEDLEVEAYIVDDEEKNPEQIDGVPVIKLESNTTLNTEYPVYIGTRGVNFAHFENVLKEIGMQQIYPVTVERDLEMRNAFLKKYFKSMGRTFEKISDEHYSLDERERKNRCNNACIYVAKSIFDKSLQQEYKLASYEKVIQVGAALTEQVIPERAYADDVGENISSRNKQFCELTALYWMWKNAKEDIVGLVHYRRHFILPDDWQERMEKAEIDVILPLPLYVTPNLENNYKGRHDPTDFDFMMDYLKEKDAEEYAEVKGFFQQNLYSPCNMFIMKKTILDELCQWMFPILEAVVANGGQKEDTYFNRYPGFLSERLITYYFEKNLKNYKVVYADKNFLS